MLHDVDEIFFSGAGFDILGHIAVVRQIEHALMIDELVHLDRSSSAFKSMWGSSAGSMVASAACLGMSSLEMTQLQRCITNIADVTDMDLGQLIERGGLDNMDKLRTVMIKNVQCNASILIGIDEITLLDLFIICGVQLNIFYTRVDATCGHFNYLTHPHARLIDCISASCALPFIFTPQPVFGDYYMDGDLLLHMRQCFDKVDRDCVVWSMCHRECKCAAAISIDQFSIVDFMQKIVLSHGYQHSLVRNAKVIRINLCSASPISPPDMRQLQDYSRQARQQISILAAVHE